MQIYPCGCGPIRNDARIKELLAVEFRGPDAARRCFNEGIATMTSSCSRRPDRPGSRLGVGVNRSRIWGQLARNESDRRRSGANLLGLGSGGRFVAFRISSSSRCETESIKAASGLFSTGGMDGLLVGKSLEQRQGDPRDGECGLGGQVFAVTWLDPPRGVGGDELVGYWVTVVHRAITGKKKESKV